MANTCTLANHDNTRAATNTATPTLHWAAQRTDWCGRQTPPLNSAVSVYSRQWSCLSCNRKQAEMIINKVKTRIGSMAVFGTPVGPSKRQIRLDFIYTFSKPRAVNTLPRGRRDFPVASDRSMSPGDDSASKSEYQDIPGGRGGWCVRLTTYHHHVPIVKKSGGLNLLETFGPVQTCNGIALPLFTVHSVTVNS